MKNGYKFGFPHWICYDEFSYIRQFRKLISKLFGTSFVAWVIKFQQKTFNRPDFPGGFFYA
jgi:hypothetical protein